MISFANWKTVTIYYRRGCVEGKREEHEMLSGQTVTIYRRSGCVEGKREEHEMLTGRAGIDLWGDLCKPLSNCQGVAALRPEPEAVRRAPEPHRKKNVLHPKRVFVADAVRLF
jgi:hypothetical protein